MRSIEELLANVDDIMDRAKAVPFSSDKCIVDARELNAVIDEIRMNLPQEIHQSKAVMTDRDNIIAGATKEADEITAKAQERARAMGGCFQGGKGKGGEDHCRRRGTGKRDTQRRVHILRQYPS